MVPCARQYRLCQRYRARRFTPARLGARRRHHAGLRLGRLRRRGRQVPAASLTSRKIRVEMDGGPLFMEWLENGHVLMTGGATEVYQGTINPALLNGAAA